MSDQKTWKDRLVDARLSEEEATELEQLIGENPTGKEIDEAINLILLKRHHDATRSI